MRVMVVHCDPVIGAYLAVILNQFRCDLVDAPPNFREAKQEARARRPDVAFVDIKLADGNTGYRLANHLADKYGTYVIMMSHELEGNDVTRFDGTFHWIRMPYSEEDITEELGEALRTRIRTASLMLSKK